MAISKVTSGGIADGTLSVEDIADDAVTAAKLANSINTDIATGVTGNTTANAALPKAGGTMTGSLAITMASTVDTVILTRGTTGHNNMLKFKTGSSDKWIVGQRNDSTDHFRFYSYGTSSDVLSIQTDGNVGVGTSSPTNKLHIDGAAGNTFEQFTNNTTGHASGDGVLIGLAQDDSMLRIENRENSHIRFNTNNTERMRITSAGSVGIGTSSPSSYNSYANNLVVYEAGHGGITIATGTGNHASLYFADGTSGNTAYRGYIDYDHADDSLDIGTGGTQSVTINSAGNVGIGTTSPSRKLHIAGSNIRVDSGYGLEFGGSASHIDGDSGYMAFDVNSSERMRITSVGNVGIGTSSPTAKLHLYEETSNTTTASNVMRLESRSSGTTGVGFGGTIYFLGERADGGLQGMAKISAVADVNTTSNLSSALTFQTATSGTNAERLRINSSGNVGIGTTVPQQKLHVVGGTRIAQAGVVNDHNLHNDTALEVRGTNMGSGTVDVDAVKLFKLALNDSAEWGAQAQFSLGRWEESGSSARSSLVISLGHGGINSSTNADVDVMTMLSSGNVGIGTVSPAATLEVVGALNGAVSTDMATAHTRTYGVTRGASVLAINILSSNHNSANSSSGRWYTVKGTSCGPGNAGNAGLCEFTLRAYSGDGTGGSGVYNFAILASSTSTTGSTSTAIPVLSWSGSGGTRTLVLTASTWTGSSGVIEFGGYQGEPQRVTWL